MNDLELVCTEEELNKVISYIDKSFNTSKNSDRQFDNITNLANFLKKNNIRLGAIECEKILDSSKKINETFYTLYLAETLLRVNKYPELANLVQLYSIRTGNELEKDILNRTGSNVKLNKLARLLDVSEEDIVEAKKIINNEDTYDYNVKVSYKKDDYYKIELVNTLNNHEQVILRNDDGVYVDTL